MDIINDNAFSKALLDKNNLKIMTKASLPYISYMSKDELENCKLIALWKAMYKYNGKSKFTTFLFRCVVWECIRFIKKELQYKKRHISLDKCCVAHVTESDAFAFELPDKQLTTILHQKYVFNMTLQQIGDYHHFSYETARQKLKLAINMLKKNYDN